MAFQYDKLLLCWGHEPIQARLKFIERQVYWETTLCSLLTSPKEQGQGGIHEERDRGEEDKVKRGGE